MPILTTGVGTYPAIGGGGGGNDAYTTAWDTNVQSNGGSAVSSTQKGFVDTLVTALKSSFGSTLENTFARLWLLANFDNNETASFTSLINPTATLMTKSGSFTSTTLGYLSNGSTGFINTHWTPSTDGGSLYNTSGGTLGFYCLTNRTTADNTIAMGCYDGSNNDQVLPLSSVSVSTVPTAFLQAGSAFTNTENHTAGLHIASRGSIEPGHCRYDLHATSGGGALTAHHGTSQAVSTGSLPSVPMYLCGRNNQSTADSFCNEKLALFFIARDFSTTFSDNMSSAVQPYMTLLGINV
jgi:hypothetical protein